MQKSEGAWKAVPDYFPPGRSPENRLAAYKAEKGLADFYLLEGRLNDAMILYQELTNVDPAESQIRAQGHAGLLQIYYLTSQDELAMDQLPHVEDYFLMLDKETQTAVEEIRRKLRPGEDQ
jgi:hypothetical protein